METPDAGQLIPPVSPEQQDAVPEPPAAPDQTGGQVPNEPIDQSNSLLAFPAPPDRTRSAPTPEPPSSPPVPPSAPPADPPAAPPPSAVPDPPPYPPTTPPFPLPEQRPRGLRGMLRRLLGGQ
ncbi:hypothetical protein ABZ442_14760 [Streptomyces triculaminicus]|uniref:hypothetical protein n=1 Tax=Streptomyces triculaminicus TaxID=2816232 RepID=UPI0033F8B039